MNKKIKALLLTLLITGIANGNNSTVSASTIPSTNVQSSHNYGDVYNWNLPTYTPTFKRLCGMDRFETAIDIAREKNQSNGTIVIANAYNFPDALAGTVFSYMHDKATILLSDASSVDSKNLQEIKTRNPQHIYILGGTGSISTNAEATLRQYCSDVQRIIGSDRFETAVNLGQDVINKSHSDTVFLTYFDNFPDALSCATFASKQGSPILYTYSSKLNSTTKEALKKWGTKKVVVIGGEGVIFPTVEAELKLMGISTERLGGLTRYDTAKKIIERFTDSNMKGLTITSGLNFPDALAGTSLASEKSMPIMIYDALLTPPSVKDFISTKFTQGYILGSEGVQPSLGISSIANTSSKNEGLKAEFIGYNPFGENDVSNTKEWVVKFNEPISYKDIDFDFVMIKDNPIMYEVRNYVVFATQGEDEHTIVFKRGYLTGLNSSQFGSSDYSNGRYGIVIKKGTKSTTGHTLNEDIPMYFQVSTDKSTPLSIY